MTRTIATVENWSIRWQNDSPFVAPECRARVLCGEVYNHPSFTDGDQLTTSHIVAEDFPNKRVHTLNTTYILGKMDPAYVDYIRKNNIQMKLLRIEDFQ